MEDTQPPLLPDNYPNEWVKRVTLVDGTIILIRPIRPDDAPRLQQGFSRLSPQTIYFRFLDMASHLSDELASRLANLDYTNQMAMVASSIEESTEELIGVARYVRHLEPGSDEADTAIAVRDDYHGRGLGTMLYNELIQYARKHGVKVFVGTIHQSNSPMMKFVRRSGLRFERQMIEHGVFLVKVWLSDPE